MRNLVLLAVLLALALPLAACGQRVAPKIPPGRVEDTTSY
jgi:hypothetical protein